MIDNNKFYSLVSDTTFKYLFKNKKTNFFFKSLIEYYTGLDINKFHLIDNELSTGNNYVSYRIDSILTNDNESIFINVEMNQNYTKSIEIRNRRYLHTIAGTSKDNKYNDKKVVIQLNFNCSRSNNYKDISRETYQLYDLENDILIKDFIIHNVFIPKEVYLCYNEDIRKKLSLFQCKSFNDMKKIIGDDKELKIIVEELEKLNKDKYFGALYDAEEDQKRLINSAKSEGFDEGREAGLEEGHEIGLEEGHEIGLKEKSREIASKMLKENMDIELISKITNLSIDEINKLK